MSTCSYCGKPANIHRRDFSGDDRCLCEDCNKKDEPGGFWCFYPDAKPPRLDRQPQKVCLECASPVPSSRTGDYCSEECETSHDRQAYEGA